MDDPRQKMMLMLLFAALAILGFIEGLRCWCRC
jgi:hypothetical protein